MCSISYNFELWKSYVDKIGEMIFNSRYSIYDIFRKDKSNFEAFENIYNSNFFKYQSENRFPIPIIGKISSGKSTFLNSILQGNYLSSSSEINTKFICLIRNNKKLKSAEFYKCELSKKIIENKLKSHEYYYFQKGKKIKGNILENIQKINNKLEKYEKKVEIKDRDINEYFYLLELNNPLFNSNEEFGDYFDFMDIPGLNEKSDFYLQKIIPIILDKCLFSIYIFDIEHYESEDTSNVYKRYSLQLNKFYNTNSIYILNKIDYISKDKKNKKDEEYHFNKFKNFLRNEEEFNVDLKNNFFLKLNSQELFEKVNAFSNLKTYILYIIGNIKEEIDDSFSFLDYIRRTFIDYFDINEEEIEKIINDRDDNKYKEYYDEKEIKEIKDNIENKGFNIDFEETILFPKFKYIFKNKKRNILPIDDLKKVYEIILNSMKKSLEKFFDWNNVLELFKIFKKSINNIFSKEDERQKYIELCDKLLESFNKEMDWKNQLKATNKWKIDIIAPLKNIIDSLINLDSSNQSLKNIKDDFQSFTYFVYNYRKIRIPLTIVD